MLYLLSYVAGDELITYENKQIIKLGYSSDFESRLKRYRNSLPLPIRVFSTADGEMSIEQKLHESLEDHRADGEWYYYTPSFLEELSFVFDLNPYDVERKKKSFRTDAPTPEEKRMRFENSLPGRFISWISKMKRGEVYCLTDFKKNITAKEYTALRVSFHSKTSSNSRYLEANGIVKESNHSGTKFYYSDV